MKFVSKLLGHSKLHTTQDHYGEVIQRKISEEMERLRGNELISLSLMSTI